MKTAPPPPLADGIVNIHGGSPYATINYTLNNGSLIIGDTSLNYGGGTLWNGGNAAGLMLECNANTEIVVHDNGQRLASLMYYEGDLVNRITIGRNMGWAAISEVVINGTITANSNKLNFPGTLDQYKINLWGTNNYGFGVAANTLQYSSQGFHKFYNSGNNANTFTIDTAGNISCSGTLTSGGNITCPAIACSSSSTALYVSGGGTSIFSGKIGVLNLFPQSMLHLGNCEDANSSPVIIFGKNNGGGGNRNCFMGYTDTFFYCIGDYGNTNGTNT